MLLLLLITITCQVEQPLPQVSKTMVLLEPPRRSEQPCSPHYPLGQRSHGPAITRPVRSEQPSSCRYLLGQSNLVLPINLWVRAAMLQLLPARSVQPWSRHYPPSQNSHGPAVNHGTGSEQPSSRCYLQGQLF